MEQPHNNHMLLRATQPGQLAYPGNHVAPASPPATTDRMRDLLARTVQDHIGAERDTATALAEIRRRLDALEQVGLAGIAATMDGLAASLGTLDAKLAARLERLDERLDDQYDRVHSLGTTLGDQSARLDVVAAKAVEAATNDVIARLASLEETVLTLAEALLRPSMRNGPA